MCMHYEIEKGRMPACVLLWSVLLETWQRTIRRICKVVRVFKVGEYQSDRPWGRPVHRLACLPLFSQSGVCNMSWPVFGVFFVSFSPAIPYDDKSDCELQTLCLSWCRVEIPDQPHCSFLFFFFSSDAVLRGMQLCIPCSLFLRLLYRRYCPPTLRVKARSAHSRAGPARPGPILAGLLFVHLFSLFCFFCPFVYRLVPV
jgi:hypothetical protein